MERINVYKCKGTAIMTYLNNAVLLYVNYFYRIYMHIIKTSQDLTRYLNALRLETPEVTIGLVPTMGALHAGHTSLIAKSMATCNVTVCTIFVNPTQFGNKGDLEKYPKPIEKDIELLLKVGCNVLFLPNFESVYPKQYKHKTYELGDLEHIIEGASRPGHFQGVCNVVHRLFDLVKPTRAFFGQKDYQQTAVIRKLVDLIKSPIQITIVPIKRESHGLAMSSRNIRLSTVGRRNAAFIFKALTQLKEDVSSMSLQEAVAKAKQFITAQKGARVDYLIAVDSVTLKEIKSLDEAQCIAVLTVVEYEGVRLLDNILINSL
jgi:pantoate--beta-alanine ligase